MEKAGGFDRLLDGIPHHPVLVFRGGGRLAGFRIEPNRARDVERVSDHDSIAERQRGEPLRAGFHDELAVRSMGGQAGCEQHSNQQNSFELHIVLLMS